MAKKNFPKMHYFWLLLVFIFWIKAYISLDPDLGWRLTTGYKIIESGIPKTDIYSYTMPSFLWVDHAWGSDVISAVLYSKFGYAGLSLAFALLATASLYLSYLSIMPLAGLVSNETSKLSSTNLQKLAFPLLILASASLMRFSGIRAQVWTWVFMSGLINLMFNEKLWAKFKILLPPLFLVWANFHGGFAAGLALLTAWVLTKSIQKKKISFSDLFLILICFLVTPINPYGFEIYREVWSSISDHDLGSRVMEWNSFFGSFSLAPMIVMVLGSVLIARYRNKLGLSIVTIFCILLYQALSTVRQVPLFILFAVPVTTSGVRLFLKEISSERLSVKRFEVVYKYFLQFALVIFAIEVLVSMRASYMLSEKKFYPVSAVSYLRASLPSGNIFSEYGWGGYLIWKMPEKKVFIDGRMASWVQHDSLSDKSSNAMNEYMRIIEGTDSYSEVFDKYGVDTVLWPGDNQRGLFDTLENKYFNQLDPAYRFLGRRHSGFNFADKLESDGWKVVYSDLVSVIYQQ